VEPKGRSLQDKMAQLVEFVAAKVTPEPKLIKRHEAKVKEALNMS
jgi:hypothetical protein